MIFSFFRVAENLRYGLNQGSIIKRRVLVILSRLLDSKELQVDASGRDEGHGATAGDGCIGQKESAAWPLGMRVKR